MKKIPKKPPPRIIDKKRNKAASEAETAAFNINEENRKKGDKK